MDNKGYLMTTAAVTTQPAVMIRQITFGSDPMQVNCGNCGKTIITSTMTESGSCAWIATLVLCLVCCPLFWVPLATDCCKDVNHTCPSCGAMLGHYKKI